MDHPNRYDPEDILGKTVTVSARTENGKDMVNLGVCMATTYAYNEDGLQQSILLMAAQMGLMQYTLASNADETGKWTVTSIEDTPNTANAEEN